MEGLPVCFRRMAVEWVKAGNLVALRRPPTGLFAVKCKKCPKNGDFFQKKLYSFWNNSTIILCLIYNIGYGYRNKNQKTKI